MGNLFWILKHKLYDPQIQGLGPLRIKWYNRVMEVLINVIKPIMKKRNSQCDNLSDDYYQSISLTNCNQNRNESISKESVLVNQRRRYRKRKNCQRDDEKGDVCDESSTITDNTNNLPHPPKINQDLNVKIRNHQH
eukprot:UN04244